MKLWNEELWQNALKHGQIKFWSETGSNIWEYYVDAKYYYICSICFIISIRISRCLSEKEYIFSIVWAVHIFGKLPAKLKYSIHIEFKNNTQRTLFTFAAVKSFPARFTGTRSVHMITYTILTVGGAMLSAIDSIATILACFIVDMDKLFYQSYKTRIKKCFTKYLYTPMIRYKF